MEEKIKELLEKINSDDSFVEELSRFYFDDIARVALKNNMIDSFVKIFKPININGVTKIFFDYFTLRQPGLDEMFREFGISADEIELITKEVCNINMDKIRDIRIGDSLARQLSGWGDPIESKEDVIKFAEPACLESMLYLFDNNVRTTMNDTEGVLNDLTIDSGVCKIWIDYSSLDDENRKRADKLIEEGLATFVEGESVKTIEISVPCQSDEKVGQVSDRIMSIIKTFKMQDTRHDDLTEENVDKIYGEIIKSLSQLRCLPVEYEDVIRTVIEYIESIKELSHEKKDFIEAFVKEKYYDEESLMEVFSEDKVLRFYIDNQIRGKSIEEKIEFISDYCFVDKKSRLIFQSKRDAIGHENYVEYKIRKEMFGEKNKDDVEDDRKTI